jgi:5-formyltetrahydrofolate cyclo-ligase
LLPSLSYIILKKDTARKIYLKKRQDLSSSEFEENSSRLIQNTIELIKEYELKFIHCFLPIHTKDEINTSPIVQYCWKNNIKVVVPVSNFEEGTMRNAAFSPDTITKQAKYNITEPINPIWIENDKIDLVITPLLAFDLKGYRVGYGKGFYDVFLKNCKKEVLKIGLSFFDPVDRIDGIRDEDIPLDYCISPQKIHSF